MALNVYTIKVLGVTLTVQTTEDTEYLRTVENLLLDTVADVQDSFSLKDSLSSAIMAGFFLADQVKREPAESSACSRCEEVERRLQRLISELDSALIKFN